MKKIISTVAALVLTLSMSMTAFAAQSVTSSTGSTTTSDTTTSSTTTSDTTTSSTTTSDTTTSSTTTSSTATSSTTTSSTTSNGSVTSVQNYSAVTATAADSSGNAVTVTITALTATQTAEAKTAVVAEFGTSVDVLAAADYDVTGASASNPITLTFTVSGVSAGDTVYVLHKHSDDGLWYRESATAGNGTVTATFTSFSPMVIVRTATVSADVHYHHYDVNVVAPTETTWGYTIYTCECGDSYVDSYVAPLSGTTTTSSPKTADNGAFGFIVAALVCGGAFVVLSRKKAA